MHGLTAERLRRALHRLPEGAAFSGRTAAWLHGLDLAPDKAIEVTVPTASKVTRRAGFRVRRSVHFERSVARGLPVTSRIQTVVDLARSLLFVEAVAVLDAPLHRRLVTRAVLVECTLTRADAGWLSCDRRSSWPSRRPRAPWRPGSDYCWSSRDSQSPGCNQPFAMSSARSSRDLTSITRSIGL